jgi:hypothetical protein
MIVFQTGPVASIASGSASIPAACGAGALFGESAPGLSASAAELCEVEHVGRRRVPGEGAELGGRPPRRQDERLPVAEQTRRAPDRVLRVVRSVVTDQQRAVTIRGRRVVDEISRCHERIVAGPPGPWAQTSILAAE